MGRKVMDVWAGSIQHRGGQQSLFRDQYNALGKLNLAAVQRIVSAKSQRGSAVTGNVLLSRFCSRTLRTTRMQRENRRRTGLSRGRHAPQGG